LLNFSNFFFLAIDARIGLQPRIVFAFYGIGGPFIDIEPGRELTITIDQLKACWYFSRKSII
jgi:hypothetical protein